jgi:hypothetical protein
MTLEVTLLWPVFSFLIMKKVDMRVFAYRRTSISGTKKAQITFPFRHFFPLKVVK